MMGRSSFAFLLAFLTACGSETANDAREASDAGADARVSHDEDASATDAGVAPRDGAIPDRPPSDAAPVEQDGAPPAPGLLVPAQGALLGHFYGNGMVVQTDARIGRKPA